MIKYNKLYIYPILLMYTTFVTFVSVYFLSRNVHRYLNPWHHSYGVYLHIHHYKYFFYTWNFQV